MCFSQLAPFMYTTWSPFFVKMFTEFFVVCYCIKPFCWKFKNLHSCLVPFDNLYCVDSFEVWVWYRLSTQFPASCFCLSLCWLPFICCENNLFPSHLMLEQASRNYSTHVPGQRDAKIKVINLLALNCSFLPVMDWRRIQNIGKKLPVQLVE